MSTFAAGIALGFALIVPIGPQNLFVLNTGFAVGAPRVFVATFAVTLCDTLLILTGALGAGALVNSLPGARTALLALGVVYLTYIGLQGLRAGVSSKDGPATSYSGLRLFTAAAGVSLLNPHAVLDTVAVIGLAANARPGDSTMLFALGSIIASLLWFMALGIGASAIRSRLTDHIRIWFQRISSIVILAFAVGLLVQFVLIVRQR